MQQNQVSKPFITRYLDFENCKWENLEGIQEDEILKLLPRSLRYEVQLHIYRLMIKTYEPLKSESKGTIAMFIRKLRLIVYPSQEFIYTAGEVADEMYFIIKGVVEIRNEQDQVIAILKKGQSFGEKAVTEGRNSVRTKFAFA
jgi:CRP-like cAMP-binding protein